MASSDDSRLRVTFELGLCALIIVSQNAGLLPVSSTPYLLLLAWWSISRRGLTWAALGLSTPARPLRTVIIGCGAGVVLHAWGSLVQEPFFDALTGRTQDLSQFENLPGNVPFLTVMLILNWTLAAFGEEMVYRGYLINRVVDVVGSSRIGWAAGLLASALFFASAHTWQGVSGLFDSSVMGVLYGLLYLGSGRNLWVPVLAHGVNNTIGFILLFLGHGV